MQYLDFKSITENRATIECGLSQGLLHQVKSGKSDLGYKTIDKILDKYQDIDKDWLLTTEYTIKLQVSLNQKLIYDNIKHFTLFARISYQISDKFAL